MSTSPSAWLGHQRPHARIPDHGPEVHVLVEREPDPQQQVTLEDAGSHPRVADRAEQDRVAGAERLELLVGQRLAGAQVPVGAEIEARRARCPGATASSTLSASPTTSGPVPSPRITPRRCAT